MERIAEFFLLTGWALFGQETEGGFNRLARFIGQGQWDANGDPANIATRIKFAIGHALVTAHNRLTN